MLTFMRWWCWCGWDVWVIGWQKENWFSHDNLSLYPRPCLADHNLDYHDDHADEEGGGSEEILSKWKFEIEVETQDFYNFIRLSCFCCLFVFILCFSQNGALVTSKRVASVDKAMRGYVIEKWPKWENWPNLNNENLKRNCWCYVRFQMMYLQRNSSKSIWNLLNLNSQSRRQLVEKKLLNSLEIFLISSKSKKMAEDQVF